ncbi:MAG: phosphatase PAP2 family protein [Dermatophilaceae bacterium]
MTPTDLNPTSTVPSAATALLRRAHALDVRLYTAVAGSSTPRLDATIRRLSAAADYSRLSMTCAATLALLGGQRGRRAAVTGMACVAVTSATVNLGTKMLARRARPDRTALGVLERRHVPMPTSTSFPSGHTAAAFAFADGVRHEWPAASVPLYALAAVVGYSRVHTGVHYPGDVAVGAGLGLALAQTTAKVMARVRPAP